MKQESTGPLFYAMYNHGHDPRIPDGEVRLHFVRYDTYFMTEEEFKMMSLTVHNTDIFEARKLAQLVNHNNPDLITWDERPFSKELVHEASSILVKTTEGYEVYNVDDASMYDCLGQIERWCELRN